jgi:hypothetical protein
MAKKADKSRNWGGKREGAGVKTDEPVRKVSITLPVSLLDEIDRMAYTGGSRSGLIATLLRQALASQ